jgi:hypothetical protein
MPNHKKFKKPPLTKKQRENLSKAMKGKRNAVGNEGGRPPILYTDKIGRAVRDMLMAQFTVDKIAEIVGVSIQTLYTWKKEIPKFLELWEYGTHGIDTRVVRSLSLRATGYKKRVVKTYKIKDEKTGADKVVDHVYSEYFPPDVRAIELYLRNRSSLKTNWSSLPVADLPPPPAPTINVNQIDLSKLDDATIKKLLSAIKPPDTKS